jgi:hypothetical protein
MTGCRRWLDMSLIKSYRGRYSGTGTAIAKAVVVTRRLALSNHSSIGINRQQTEL